METSQHIVRIKIGILIFSYLTSQLSLAAKGVVTIQSRDYTVFYQDHFESTNFSSNKAGKPQLIADKNLAVRLYYQGSGLVKILAYKLLDNNTLKATYVVGSDSKMYLVSLQKSSQNRFFDEIEDLFGDDGQEIQDSKCEISINPIVELNQDVLKIASKNSICAAAYDAIIESVNLVLKLPRPTEKNQSGIIACLKSKEDDIKKATSMSDEKYKMVYAGLKLKASQLLAKPNSASEQVTCVDDQNHQFKNKKAWATEDGQVSINMKHPDFEKDISKTSSSNQKRFVKSYLTKELAHEYLHLAGLDQTEEQTVDRIIEICSKHDFLIQESFFMPTVKGPVSTGSDTQVVVKEIANPALPEAPVGQVGGVGRASTLAANATAVEVQSAPEINQLVKSNVDYSRTAKLIEARDIETVVAESQQRTAPIRNYVSASMDMAFAKAEAAGRVAADGKVGTASLRSPASATSTNSKSMLGKKIKGRDGQDYTVVEEYLADDAGSAVASAASANSGRSAAVGARSAPQGVNSMMEGPSADGTMSASAANRGGGVMPSVPSAGGAAAVASAQRAAGVRPPPSAGSSVAGGGSSGAATDLTSQVQSGQGGVRRSISSSDEIGQPRMADNAPVAKQTVKMISETPYTEIRAKYRDPEFRKLLSDSDVTILNLRNQQIGAPKGKVRYLDNGTKLILMKSGD